MSVASGYLPRREWFNISLDRQAIYLAGLFLAVQAVAVGLGLWVAGQGVAVESPGNVDGAAAGAGWAVLEVGFAAVLLGIVVLSRYLPEELRKAVKVSVVLSLAYLLGAIGAQTSVGHLILAALIGTYLTLKVVDVLGLWWLLNNAAAVFIAVYGGVVAGLMLNEWALLTFLLGMTLYDRLFADKRDWMMSMAGFAVNLRLPVLFIKPSRFRFDWDGLLEEDSDALDEDNGAWGIGTADLMIPAAFTVAVATGESLAWPAAGALVVTGAVGLAALRIREKMLTQGSGAGLPPLMAAVALAFVAVLVPSVAYGVVG